HLAPKIILKLPWYRQIGSLLLLFGIGVSASGLKAFADKKTSFRPGDQPRAMVTTGPYRFTRNPMYLGIAAFLTGIFFLSRSIYLLLPPVLFTLIIDRVLLPFEEQLLGDTFGESYRKYAQKVRRWI
ncbi:MAG: isoprenylcysteine carboxylmethyltransferase family protein, partial [Verrucomicrobia bacterium]|nr:isoprenylcysteine carboxylmethyltransferase family protein [Verrucomicrobiota bacterium]